MWRSISGQTLVQLAGKAGSTLLGLLVVSLLTRNLGQAGFGEYTTVITYLQFFGILVDFGLTMSLAKELGVKKYTDQELLENTVSFRTITATAAYLFAIILVWLLPYSNIIKTGVTIIALGSLVNTITTSLSGLFQAKLATHWLVIADLISRVVLIAGTAYVAVSGGSILHYLIVLLLSNLVLSLSLIITAQKLIGFGWSLNLTIWKHLWLVTWPAAITIALNLIYFKADTLVLSLVRTSAEVGIYGAGYKVLEVLMALPAILGGLILPLASSAYVNNNVTKLKSIYQTSFNILLATGLAVIAGSYVIGTSLMVWLSGPDFAISGKILSVLSIATAFIFIGNISGYIIFAMDKQKKIIPAYIIAAVLGLAVYLILIPRFGVWGAAWGTVGVEAFMAGANIIYLWRQGLRPSPNLWPKILLATAGLILGLLIPAPLFFKIICGLVFYFALVYALKLWPKDLNITQLT